MNGKTGSAGRLLAIPRMRGVVLTAGVGVTWVGIMAGCAAPNGLTPADNASLSDEAASEVVREIIATPLAPPALGPYSQAVRVGETVYLAGQIALDVQSGEMVSGGIEPETRKVMENLGAVLSAAGLSFQHVVQSQVFLADLDEFAAMNQVYGEFFPRDPPVRATVEAARLPRDARVEIMFTAVGPRP